MDNERKTTNVRKTVKNQKSPASYVRVPCALKGISSQCPNPECDGTHNRLCTKWAEQSSR